MKELRTMYYYLLFLPSIICITGSQASIGLASEKSGTSESMDFSPQYKDACLKIYYPSKNNCALASLEWKYRCCYVTWENGDNDPVTGKKESCMYFYDKKKYMNVYPTSVHLLYGYSDVKIQCCSFYFRFNLFLLFSFIMFILF